MDHNRISLRTPISLVLAYKTLLIGTKTALLQPVRYIKTQT